MPNRYCYKQLLCMPACRPGYVSPLRSDECAPAPAIAAFGQFPPFAPSTVLAIQLARQAPLRGAAHGARSAA
jgi:hypothetical protein